MEMANGCKVDRMVSYFDIDLLIISGWKGNWTLPEVKHEDGARSPLLLEINLIEGKSIVHVKDPGTESLKNMVIIDPTTLEGAWGNVETHKTDMTNGQEVRMIVKYIDNRSMCINIFMYGVKSETASQLCDMLMETCMKGQKNKLSLASENMCNKDSQLQLPLQASWEEPCKFIPIWKVTLQPTSSSSPQEEMMMISRPAAEALTLKTFYEGSLPVQILVEWYDECGKPSGSWILTPSFVLADCKMSDNDTVSFTVVDRKTGVLHLNVVVEPMRADQAQKLYNALCHY